VEWRNYHHLRYFWTVPTVALDEAVRRYGFQAIGEAKHCRMSFHAITSAARALMAT
jgi:hypothetical protein